MCKENMFLIHKCTTMSFLNGMQFLGLTLLSLAFITFITVHTAHAFLLCWIHQTLPLINVEPQAFIDFTSGSLISVTSAKETDKVIGIFLLLFSNFFIIIIICMFQFQLNEFGFLSAAFMKWKYSRKRMSTSIFKQNGCLLCLIFEIGMA